MKKILLCIAILIIVLGYFIYSNNVDVVPRVQSNVPDQVKSSLERALEDEYKAYATYKGIIDSYGEVRPFSMIIQAEEQHIASLKTLFGIYNIQIPENAFIGNITIPSTLKEACSIGVEVEKQNVSLYKNELLPSVSSYADITATFTNLMNASQDRHLPAFTRCS
jgi:hypothetical protein